jgi:hypothetical protein
MVYFCVGRTPDTARRETAAGFFVRASDSMASVDEPDDAPSVLNALAAINPFVVVEDGDYSYCFFCEEGSRGLPHRDTCIWSRAVKVAESKQ